MDDPSDSTSSKTLPEAPQHSTLVASPSGLDAVVRETFARPVSAPPGYELREELGRGAMGVVYLAEQTALRRPVALKLVRAEILWKERVVERAADEAVTVARLQHPNIVQIFEVGTWPETGPDAAPFLVLEYLSGGTLATRLAGTPQSPQQAALWLVTLARAVQYAHEQGVIHRDLKPANILFAADGQPKVSDFGLAKRLDVVSSSMSGEILGTPSYMSPEQAEGSASGIGPGTDVWALGAILYECLTGRPPFKASSAVETVFQVIGTEPVLPRALVTTVPKDLETIAMKCLRKEPAHRYASAAAMADDVQRFLDGRPILARPVGPLGRASRWASRNPLAAGLATGLLVALVGGLIGMGILLRQARTAQTRAEDLNAKWSESEAAAQSVLNEFVIDELYAANATADPPAKRARLRALVAKARVRFKGQIALLTTALNFIANAYNAIKPGGPPEPEDFDAAKALYDEVWRTRLDAFGPDHPGTLQSVNNRVWHQSWDGDYRKAEQGFHECYSNSLRSLGPKHSMTFTLQHNRAWALVNDKQYEEAEREARACLKVREELQGKDYPQVSNTRQVLADALMGLGRGDEARKLYAYNRTSTFELYGPDHASTVKALERWASAELDAGNAAEVANEYDRVEPLLRKTYEAVKGDPEKARIALERLGKLDDAAGRPRSR